MHESLVEVFVADLSNLDHRRAIVDMINTYAQDPMGNGGPLPAEVLSNLPDRLRQHPTTCIFLAYDRDQPVGIAVCFYGFSTFAAQRLLNIHDLSVIPTHRGRGIGRQLLSAAERHARDTNCCKLTLEVLENNLAAKALYRSAGFAQLTYQADAGGALFYCKSL
jgi:ribosomal protein S18 acetylase RimI-like enzyme